jgi:hypothetical protein
MVGEISVMNEKRDLGVADVEIHPKSEFVELFHFP